MLLITVFIVENIMTLFRHRTINGGHVLTSQREMALVAIFAITTLADDRFALQKHAIELREGIKYRSKFLH
jgi:hypothetical protein